MKNISLIIPLIGKYSTLIDNFEKTVLSLEKIKEDVEIIFISYDSSWRFSPQYQLLGVTLTGCKIIELKEKAGSFGYLLNKGLESVESKFTICMLLSQVGIMSDTQLILEYIKNNCIDNQIGYITRTKDNLIYPSNQVNYGHLQIKKIYNLGDLIIPTHILKKFKFNEDSLLEQDLDWDISLRLSRNYDFISMITSGYESQKLNNYPFEENYMISNDIIHRYIIALGTQEKYSQYEVKKMFLNDLKTLEKKRIEKIILKETSPDRKNNKSEPYKITILGGFWEYHHNQICFFNYFDKLFGLGFCSYKVGFDNEVDESFLKNSDLVILTRCRSENAIRLVEYCNEKKIPTIYMIDDNWISIGRDYPEAYGNLFVSGNPNYDNFIKIISLCDETWCYNEILEEDIKKYAKKTFKFKLNVDTEMYKPLKVKSDEKIIIGYAGSLRSNNEAFKAMIELAKKYDYIEVFVVGILSSEQEKLFEGIKYKREDFMPYVRYSKMISDISPDILLAPLDDNRTSNSKCFNKYLESATIRAVGIYSKVKPYTDIIEDGKNGFLVEKNTVNEWLTKLELAIKDKSKLRNMQIEAHEHIEENYSTVVLLDEFAQEVKRMVKIKND